MTKKKARPILPEEPVHKNGLTTGYRYHAQTNKYYPAPMYVDQFDTIRARRIAVESLLQATMNYLLGEQERCTRANAAVWKSIEEDYGQFFRAKGWIFDHAEKAVRPMTPEELKVVPQ